MTCRSRNLRKKQFEWDPSQSFNQYSASLWNHQHPTRCDNGSVTDQQQSRSCSQEFGYESKVQEDDWPQEGELFGGNGHKYVPRATSFPDCSIKGVQSKEQEEREEVDALASWDTSDKWTDKVRDGSCKDWRGKCALQFENILCC